MSLCEVVEDLLGISRILMKLAFDNNNFTEKCSTSNGNTYALNYILYFFLCICVHISTILLYVLGICYDI